MDEYCDAIQYEGLVFAATTRGTVFAWDPRSFIRLSSTIIIIVSSTRLRVKKLPFTN